MFSGKAHGYMRMNKRSNGSPGGTIHLGNVQYYIKNRLLLQNNIVLFSLTHTLDCVMRDTSVTGYH